MCCGCGNGCGMVSGNLLYVIEKLVSFCALTSVVLCIVVTLAVTLAVGIGLGYNYCFVASKVNTGEMDTGLATTPPKKKGLRDSLDENQDEILDELLRRSLPRGRNITSSVVNGRDVFNISMKGNIDLVALIDRIRARNKPVTLHLIP